MSSNSAIEWTGSTWNPIAGCTPVSPGCLHCYAATMSHRLEGMGQEKYRGLTVLRNGVRTFNGKISFDEEALTIPLKRKKPETYFVNSMSDLFHESVPFDFVDKVFAVMALCPQHTFQVLTKRPERMAEYLGDADERGDCIGDAAAEFDDDFSDAGGWNINLEKPLPNVWLGTSVEDQQRADERIPHLLKCPAAVRFLSVEPLLGAVDLASPVITETTVALTKHIEVPPAIDWVIVGGESGGGARWCAIDWVRDIVRQCRMADVPVFVKQLGSNSRYLGGLKSHPMNLKDKKGGDPSEWSSDLRVREFPRNFSKSGLQSE